MKEKKVSAIAALLAIVAALGGMQTLAAEGAGNGKAAARPTDREMKVLAETAYISTVSATNYQALSRFMSESAKGCMSAFCRRMLFDGKQCFMPDFFKVKYVVVGALDAQGYVAGFYNPFYDAWLMLKVVDGDGIAIDGFKVVSGDYFAGEGKSGYPPASGAVPADAYLNGVYLQVKSALIAMRDHFAGKEFRSLFERMPEPDSALVGKLAELAKFRIAQALKVADDKRVLRDAVICNSIICRGNANRFVADDASTQLTVKTLSESLDKMRSGFKVVAYFPSGDESNLVYSHRLMPTLMIQANVREDGKVRMRMFDANTITKNVK